MVKMYPGIEKTLSEISMFNNTDMNIILGLDAVGDKLNGLWQRKGIKLIAVLAMHCMKRENEMRVYCAQ